MKSQKVLVPLRRTFQPYVGNCIILSFATVIAVIAALKSSDFMFLWAGLVSWILFGVYAVYFGLRYKVLWDDAHVVMRASGKPELCIPFNEISAIRYKIASPGEWFAQSRPFRRIVVYGRKNDSDAHVDISLRHFHLDDIDQLLAAIHEHRPEIEIPYGKWIGKVGHARSRT
jgi:hypothetical protein